MSDNTSNYPHYFKRVPSKVKHVDIYAVLRLWDVHCPAIQHAVKKLLCAGERGAKGRATDLREAVDAIQRAIALGDEFSE